MRARRSRGEPQQTQEWLIDPRPLLARLDEEARRTRAVADRELDRFHTEPGARDIWASLNARAEAFATAAAWAHEAAREQSQAHPKRRVRSEGSRRSP